MDANKLEKLREMEYSIPKTCDTCAAGAFVLDRQFGVCHANTYTHEKHTGDDRFVSVYRYGTCPRYIAVESAKRGPWAEFFQ